MKNIFEILNARNKTVYRLILFLIAITIVALLFPREGTFRYEYAKGRPWKYQVLMAPFDFPVLKSQQDITKERDSLMSNFRPYFKFDTTLIDDAYWNFESTIEKETPALIQKYSATIGTSDPLQWNAFFHQIQQNLSLILKKGIILLPDEYHNALPDKMVTIQRGSFAEPFAIGEFQTSKNAYAKLIENCKTNVPTRFKKEIETFNNLISDLQLNRFLTPNVIYDKTRSETEYLTQSQKISLATGIVLSGQRIIATGDLVNDKTFKILNSLKKEHETRLGSASNRIFIILGQILIISFFFGCVYFFLFYYRNDVFESLRSVSFILLMMVMMIVMIRLSKSFHFPVHIIPFAILPVMIRIFLDSRLAFSIHVTTMLMASFMVENSYQFLLLHVPVGLIAILTLFVMVRRSQLFKTAIAVFINYAILYTGLSFVQENNYTQIDPVYYTQFAINVALLLLTYPLIYFVEKMFGFISDVTLIELSDTNHPLLRAMADEAPGTFQHSIQVGNLAQEAAYSINAKPLLIRAGAMYHDIGKTTSPLYFTENQNTNFNPHDGMEFNESAKTVISHIENGVRIARSHKIPEQIIDFIRTHQGTMRTKYFYNSFKNKYPDQNPDPQTFNYPGPTPFSKETAILMMADSVEAASRSLKNYTNADIDNLVEKIIDDQIKENQFINAPITFKEITKVKEVFKRKLKNMYHVRVEYPELKVNTPEIPIKRQ